ncbi:very short patch repair endonuclease [Candidatus Palauibacter irciniicola]|uniref:very short patch repair endonuclease n=1 Tax=Candidatus Palauibacter irciniicola TaxID=3056733 RepID=UPI003B01DBED
MDTRTAEQRRWIMQAVKSRDTGPEMVVRRLLHSSGYRYRVHRRDLPGRADVAFLSRRKAIFVHGCFWHGHGCPKGRLPKSRLDYWGPKLNANKERDRRKEEELRSMGWDVLTIWQCETADLEALAGRLHGFLGRRAAGRVAGSAESSSPSLASRTSHGQLFSA